MNHHQSSIAVSTRDGYRSTTIPPLPFSTLRQSRTCVTGHVTMARRTINLSALFQGGRAGLSIGLFARGTHLVNFHPLTRARCECVPLLPPALSPPPRFILPPLPSPPLPQREETRGHDQQLWRCASARQWQPRLAQELNPLGTCGTLMK